MLRTRKTSLCRPFGKAVHKLSLPGDNKEQLCRLFRATETYPYLSRLVPVLPARLSTGFAHNQATEAKNHFGLIPRFGAALLLPTMKGI